MTENGFDFPIPSYAPGQADTIGWRLFGLWDMSEAEQYGYFAPPDPAVTAELQLQQTAQLSTEAKAALPGCQQKAVKQFPEPGASTAAISAQTLGYQAYQQTLDDKTGKAIIAEWQKCMTAQGIQVNANHSGPLGPAYTDSLSAADQILLAVKDVTCKTKYNVAQRLADIDASYQVVLINKYQAVLNTELQQNNADYAAAQKYLAANE